MDISTKVESASLSPAKDVVEIWDSFLYVDGKYNLIYSIENMFSVPILRDKEEKNESLRVTGL